MLRDLGHPAGDGEEVYDVTFENVQAGLRTDLLFRAANQRGGIVLGTGDLSELALGWCTYGVGDQMSHYGVNAGVPKTLIQHLIRWVVSSGELGDEPPTAPCSASSTPRSAPSSSRRARARRSSRPRTPSGLTPSTTSPSSTSCAAATGRARSPSSPSTPGPTPRPALAGRLPRARPGRLRPRDIRRWMHVFLRRFFQNQFKRSAIPNGPRSSPAGRSDPAGTGGCRRTPRPPPGSPSSSARPRGVRRAQPARDDSASPSRRNRVHSSCGSAPIDS